MTSEPNVLDVENMPLDQWLELIFKPPPNSLFADYQFPTEGHKKEYLSSIHSRTDEEIKNLLLKFLIHTGSLGIDEFGMDYLIHNQKSSPEKFKRLMELQFYRRLSRYEMKVSPIPPWEGITWILDLLPYFPGVALEALAAYTLAHAQLMPDGRLEGMFEAEEVIRAKYIGYPHNQVENLQALMAISSREFEHLIEELYSQMGYETQLTPPQKDGGRDVIATRKDVGKLEQLRIECKHYANPVGVELARALLGVVSDEKVNKGVLITTSRFTKGAKALADRNPRLELIPGTELVPLLNEHLGSDWALRINQYILRSQRKHSNEDTGAKAKKSA